MSDEFKKPSMKEKRFAKEYIKNNGDATAAALVTTGATTRDSAKVMGSRILARPHVRRTIEIILEEKYPDLEKDYSDLLKLALKKAGDGQASLKEINETLSTVAKITGYMAPKQTETKTLKATVKLPGSD